jgi:hypothetical protein
MLTAAVRDLHKCYPCQFLIDVRTLCPDLWENNPHISSIADSDPEAELIECSYPLIDRANSAPYHCLHGFIEFLNDRLKLAIKPTAFKGDIHLSEQEKAWYSQVHEVTGKDTPFWIVAAGGKYDITIKWWQHERYQEVINHFRGKIQFVQIGEYGHYHPKLDGVIDLRGRTSLRELIRLVYHAQGVLCSVTALMHLAAAVETRPTRSKIRPCVVIAGGREPAYWETYPGHQFIHTNGALPCCIRGGCWKDRFTSLRDGDERDRPRNRCVDIVNGLPHCMEMISPAEVARRIETFYEGGALKYLTRSQYAVSRRGMSAMDENSYDKQSLSIHNAGTACDRFIKSIPRYPGNYHGRGIVICAGGVQYFTNAWVCIHMLRRLGCQLPIEVWYIDKNEMNETMAALLKPMGAACISAWKVKRSHPVRLLQGWALKPYAILYSRFREVLFLDADNVPVVDPEFLFHTPQYREAGAIFWPDYEQPKKEKNAAIWRSCGLRHPREREFESGQIVVDKQRCWAALALAVWFNENSDFYYQYLHGDKETFHLAFRKMRKSYALVPHPIHPLEGTMCQHDFNGRRIFQHRNTDKWDLFPINKRIKDFWFERECRDYLSRLRKQWDGQLGWHFKSASGRRALSRKSRGSPRIHLAIISESKREDLRKQTLENWARTDWAHAVPSVHLHENKENSESDLGVEGAYTALRASLEQDADYLLLMDDDLDFNRYIRRNLLQWKPIKNNFVTLASLYNPNVRETACDLQNNARVVESQAMFDGKAFLISRELARYLVRHWKNISGRQDFKISRLAGRLKKPILYHAPSLVQRVEDPAFASENLRCAMDFDPSWRA